MTSTHRLARLLLSLAPLMPFVGPAAAAAPAYRVTKFFTGPTHDRLQEMVGARKYEEAAFAVGWQVYSVCEAIRPQVESTDPPDGRLAACRAYLRFFPYYDHPPGLDEMKRWAQVAARYVALCKELPASCEELPDVLRQNEAALPVFEELLRIFDKQQWERFGKLADQIVEEYPRSRFAPATVVLVRAAGPYHVRPFWLGDVFAQPYQQLKARNAPVDTLLWLLAEDGRRHSIYQPEELTRALQGHQAALKLAQDKYARSYFLLKAAESALRLGNAESLSLARELFRQYLAEFPNSGSAAEARFGLVKSYLADKQAEEAERVARELEKGAPPGTSFAEEYLVIFETCISNREYPKGIALLQEVVRRFPENRWIPTAYLLLAEAYEKLGDVGRMIEAYETAASVSAAAKKGTVWPDNSARQRAVRKVATYYMTNGEWDKALRWWGDWKPSSFCGTCGVGMEADRAENAAICLAHLDRHGDAVRVCLHAAAELESEFFPALLVILVRLYWEADQLADFERIIKQFEEAKIAEIKRALADLRVQGDDGPSETHREMRRHVPTYRAGDLLHIVALQKEGNIR